MNLAILTLFPQIVESYFQESIMQRSVQNGLIRYSVVDIRDFAFDKHRTCDDYPYGGGPGMVLKPEPLGLALDSVGAAERRTVFPTPSGKRFCQTYAQELSREESLVLICGRYEGIDQRIIDCYVDDEISVGDYVMSSGEIASLVVIDTVARLISGVISEESLKEESFSNGLVEYPQYTRPESYHGIRVPDVLLSGHHANIAEWRKQRSLEKTMRNRPDLMARLE